MLGHTQRDVIILSNFTNLRHFYLSSVGIALCPTSASTMCPECPWVSEGLLACNPSLCNSASVLWTVGRCWAWECHNRSDITEDGLKSSSEKIGRVQKDSM